MGKQKHKKNGKYTAKTADLYALYQEAVQDTDFETDFTSRTFKSLRKRPALTLREDFCGTGLACATWVSKKKNRTAVGRDLDRDVLAWGRANNIEPLGRKAERVRLDERDVRDPDDERYDLITAMNFSYNLFLERSHLREYFFAAREALVDDGVFMLDAYGGWEAQQVIKEPRDVDGNFTYVWHQASYNPIDARAINHIHFEFNDGTEIRRAFSYEWRLWTIPELTELLREAGFSSVHVYWEDEGDDGLGNGVYRRRKRVTNDPGWIAFIAAER